MLFSPFSNADDERKPGLDGIQNYFKIVTEGRRWLDLAYVLACFVWGIVLFIFGIVTFAVSLALCIIVVGIPMTLVCLWLYRIIVGFEARISRSWLGGLVPPRLPQQQMVVTIPPHMSQHENVSTIPNMSLFPMIKSLLVDMQTYMALLYVLVVRFITSLSFGLVGLVAISIVSKLCINIPLSVFFKDHEVDRDFKHVDEPFDTIIRLACFFVGLLLLPTALLVNSYMAKMLAMASCVFGDALLDYPEHKFIRPHYFYDSLILPVSTPVPEGFYMVVPVFDRSSTLCRRYENVQPVQNYQAPPAAGGDTQLQPTAPQNPYSNV